MIILLLPPQAVALIVMKNVKPDFHTAVKFQAPPFTFSPGTENFKESFCYFGYYCCHSYDFTFTIGAKEL